MICLILSQRDGFRTKKLSHPSGSPPPPRGHRPPPLERADAGGARSAQRGRSRRERAAALRTCRRRHRRRCRWIGSSYPPHGKGRCPPSAHCVRHFPRKRGKLLCRYPKPSPLSRGAVNVSQSHIAVARVLGTFSHTTCYPISFVLWTCFLDRSARGTAQAVEGAQKSCCTSHISYSSLFTLGSDGIYLTQAWSGGTRSALRSW